MNTICCNNCKISINYNNGISYQSHYLSVSVSFPRNVRALALKCQNIPQKLQVRNCFSQNKKRFRKKIAVLLSRTVYTIIVAHFYYRAISTFKHLVTILARLRRAVATKAPLRVQFLPALWGGGGGKSKKLRLY